ncbi:hypothetical protein PCASD_23224 [Puccinia coronata f. sp. avenae]|uniref:Retroviral polymerase SH3-like domain-containing protein n=1 Tax=Puccinia coronata f. sp. avenae TaxID=200324 RepID=A0A2N5SPE7_9BASI|nr:hypothetical protein PCASD_23224 [Puccinia coronata f. sp. avenae]
MWHEVLKSYCLSLNQIPRNSSSISPWELVHGYKLPPNFLRTLGTGTVVLKFNRVKGKKFEEKGQEGILIGFNTLLNSYRILSRTGSVIKSKHVRFLKEKSTQFQTKDSDAFLPDLKESKSTKESATCEEPDADERHPHADSPSLDLAGTDNESNNSPDSSDEVAEILVPQSKQDIPPTRTLRDRSQLKPPEQFVNAANHYIDNRELNKQLMMTEEEFKDKFSNNHFIDNKGLDDKVKKFGSNPKTRHIDLKTKGIRQELKLKNIKITLIRTFNMLANALTKAAPKSSILNLIHTVDPNFNLPDLKSHQSQGV